MGLSTVISLIRLQGSDVILVVFYSQVGSKSVRIILSIHLLTSGYLINYEVRVSPSFPKFAIAEKKLVNPTLMG